MNYDFFPLGGTFEVPPTFSFLLLETRHCLVSTGGTLRNNLSAEANVTRFFDVKVEGTLKVPAN